MEIINVISEIVLFVGTITPILLSVLKLTNGLKCQLRSEMLRIYYKNVDNKTIRQYEYENFVYLYDAYKSLKGNSFIEKIYSEIKQGRVIT